MDLNCSESNGGLRPGAIVGGSFLLLVGVTMFLERAGLADIAPWRIIGPACLIILGRRCCSIPASSGPGGRQAIRHPAKDAAVTIAGGADSPAVSGSWASDAG
jgi:hypothetical protein